MSKKIVQVLFVLLISITLTAASTRSSISDSDGGGTRA